MQALGPKALRFLTPLSLALALASGCGTSSPSCQETAHLYNLDQSNATGQRGREFVHRAIGEYAVELTRVQSPDEPSRVSPTFPDKSHGTLTITLVQGAQWAHVISKEMPCTSINCADIAISCSNYLSVPVTARLTTLDESIDETWHGELVGDEILGADHPPRLREDGNARIRFSRDASSFLGDFKVSPPALEANETINSHQVILEAEFQDGKLLWAEIIDRSDSRIRKGPGAGQIGRIRELITMTPLPSAS